MRKPSLWAWGSAVVAAAVLCLALEGAAAVSRVRCVVWQGDPAKYHTAISGQAAQLKCVVDTDSTSTIYYKWVFGDGTESAVSSTSGSTRYNLETTHVYTAAVGTPFTAKLRVDTDSSLANAKEDAYLLKIEDNILDARVNIAIDRGLWFLYKTRKNLDSSYSLTGEPLVYWHYGNYHASPTASAVLAFEINNHKETGNDNEDPYVEAVTRGLNWIFTGKWPSYNNYILRAVSIGNQTYGNPDSNGNGIGIEAQDWDYNPAYQGGMVMDAIVATGTPNASTGRDFDGDGKADTYAKVLQDMVDMYAWGQYDDTGSVGGGWRYSWNTWPDNSACQWAAIGMIPAQDSPWNCTVPQWVKDRNNVWLWYSYSAASKRFGYTDTGCVNTDCVATRPSGMVQMVMSVPNYKTDTRWTTTESWFATSSNWNWFVGAARTYYGWYAFVKAMRLSNTETLSNGFNWYRGTNGIAERLLAEQEADGSWPAGGHSTHPGDYGDTLVTAWAIGMLKPALFAAAPVACFTAKPNPSYENTPITFDPSCSGHSETGKDISNLTLFEWDWDHDGIYDQSTTTPAAVTHAFSCASLPCTYPVTLRVTDDNSPALTATYVLNVVISNPPHPPVADADGAYMVSLCSNDSLTLDGSGSYDPNEGQHETGCSTCPNDTITAWDWDLTPPLTGFSDKSGKKVVLSGAELASYFPAGSHSIGLRVTDNTKLAYPGSGQDNLTDSDFTSVASYQGCICNLAARPKSGKVQITWTHTGAASYDVYRSTTGPNSGFVLIADNVMTTYATYLDGAVVNGTKYYYRVVSSDGCGSNVASATPTTR